ncbi:hypothetical protein KY337_04770 [Candidatus Woesearchaeota archaeon]|nr:hypothetical protein [Candidatus Woesearchaeota archaeon]
MKDLDMKLDIYRSSDDEVKVEASFKGDSVLRFLKSIMLLPKIAAQLEEVTELLKKPVRQIVEDSKTEISDKVSPGHEHKKEPKQESESPDGYWSRDDIAEAYKKSLGWVDKTFNNLQFEAMKELESVKIKQSHKHFWPIDTVVKYFGSFITDDEGEVGDDTPSQPEEPEQKVEPKADVETSSTEDKPHMGATQYAVSKGSLPYHLHNRLTWLKRTNNAEKQALYQRIIDNSEKGKAGREYLVSDLDELIEMTGPLKPATAPKRKTNAKVGRPPNKQSNPAKKRADDLEGKASIPSQGTNSELPPGFIYVKDYTMKRGLKPYHFGGRFAKLSKFDSDEARELCARLDEHKIKVNDLSARREKDLDDLFAFEFDSPPAAETPLEFTINSYCHYSHKMLRGMTRMGSAQLRNILKQARNISGVDRLLNRYKIDVRGKPKFAGFTVQTALRLAQDTPASVEECLGRTCLDPLDTYTQQDACKILNVTGKELNGQLLKTGIPYGKRIPGWLANLALQRPVHMQKTHLGEVLGDKLGVGRMIKETIEDYDKDSAKFKYNMKNMQDTKGGTEIVEVNLFCYARARK